MMKGYCRNIARTLLCTETLPITHARGYSYLKATMGSTRMARRAGM